MLEDEYSNVQKYDALPTAKQNSRSKEVNILNSAEKGSKQHNKTTSR